ncbi:MAG: hypothetical protein KKF56_01490 [Nanoarchaeota archaeon]|nr:hypothetical protein [Nanoarchaeota archaeon]
MNKFDKIVQDIKEVKIQGATNIAKAGLKAYVLKPGKMSKKKLFGARPTEPMLFNSIKFLDKGMDYGKILEHFEETQDRINKEVFKLIKGKKIVYTHCHSSTVIKALVYAKKKGRNPRKSKISGATKSKRHHDDFDGFEVYNTETRPLFQGRKTARDLKNAGINVTMFVDSAIKKAAEKSDIVFLGADAILKDGVINKIGSDMIGEILEDDNIPIYILADSWKYYSKNIKIEERKAKEVWKNKPKGIKIENPAFEKIEKKYIKGIVSELGVLKFGDFLRKVQHN